MFTFLLGVGSGITRNSIVRARVLEIKTVKAHMAWKMYVVSDREQKGEKYDVKEKKRQKPYAAGLQGHRVVEPAKN